MLQATSTPVHDQLFRTEPVLAYCGGPHSVGGPKFGEYSPLCLILQGLAGCVSVFLDMEYPGDEHGWTVEVTAEKDKKEGLVDLHITIRCASDWMVGRFAEIRKLVQNCPAVKTFDDRIAGITVCRRST